MTVVLAQPVVAAAQTSSATENGTAPARGGGGLSQSGSLLLDAVRFAAAAAVLLHHFTDSRLSRGFPHLGAVGHEAVCVFFVLSGFVIRFITATRRGTLTGYAIDRVSRLYSVVVPALAFTVLCEVFAALINPAVYASVRDGFTWGSVPLHLLANLTFTAQCWGYGLNPLSNAPFWSLSYECLYYLLYALVHYRVRGRWAWVMLALLLAGPSIALLFPVWWMGVLACDLYLRLSKARHGPQLAGSALLALAVSFAALLHPIAHLLRAIGHENRAVWLTQQLAGIPGIGRLTDASGHLPWLTEASLSFVFIGAITATAIPFGLLLLDRHCPDLPPVATRWTRTVADSTFALYLFHVPLLLLAIVVLGHPVERRGTATALLLGIVLVSIPLARALDWLKAVLRSHLRAHFAAS